MSDRREFPVFKVALIGGAALAVWWFLNRPRGFGLDLFGFEATQADGIPGSSNPVQAIIDRDFNFVDIGPDGARSSGTAKLRDAAPLVLRGTVNGFRTIPGDTTAARAVQIYAASNAQVFS